MPDDTSSPPAGSPAGSPTPPPAGSPASPPAAAAANGAAPDQGPAMRIIAQYAKDVSFENPRGPRRANDPQPRINVDVEVRPAAVSDGLFEDELRLNFKGVIPAEEGEDTTIFLGEIVYAALVQIAGMSRDQTEFALLAEAPRQMFPFVRRIVADLTRDGGHPPFYMDPINFLALYERERTRRTNPEAPAPQAD